MGKLTVGRNFGYDQLIGFFREGALPPVGVDNGMAAAIAALSERGWFAERPPEVRRTFAEIARLRDYATGAPLFLSGDAPDGIYGLVRGALDITIPRSDGTDLIAHRADPGFWIGDLALIGEQTRLVSVFAVEQTQVAFLPQEPLRRAAAADPRLYSHLYALSHENTSTILRLIANLATTPSDVRVALRLLHQEAAQPAAGAELRLTHATLAELVALSVPTVQRVLRRFESSGLIELGYGRIRILNRQRLRALCDAADPSLPGEVR